MVQMFDILEKKLDGINFYQAIDFSVANHDSELEDLNTFQLDKGVDMEGKDLGQYKYLSYKGRLRPVDLKQEGDFRRSIKAISKQGQISFSASDWKAPILTKKYGENIIGLSRADLQNGVIKDILLDDIIKNVSEQINVIS